MTGITHAGIAYNSARASAEVLWAATRSQLLPSFLEGDSAVSPFCRHLATTDNPSTDGEIDILVGRNQ